MRVLVTGASGFVGSQLIPRLVLAGHRVQALGRDPERVRRALARDGGAAPEQTVEVLAGDAVSGSGLERALAGVEVAYYLIHSMEPSATSFAQREQVSAENFAAAAAAAGVARVVYLGGPEPRRQDAGVAGDGGGSEPSAHLASRARVEDILRTGVPDTVTLRASIVIGARSRSFRLLVRLVERLPILALPAWQRFRTCPVDGRDVIEMLLGAATARLRSVQLDAAGAEILSYGEMLTRIADLMLLNRPALRLGLDLTPVTGRFAAAIAGEDPALVLPLMEGLQGDLLPVGEDAAAALGVRLHSFDAAVERALAEWERSEPLAAR